MSTPRSPSSLVVAWCLAAGVFFASAAGDAKAPPRVETRIPLDRAAAAVFRTHCVRCHGPDEASGGLRLDSYDAIMRGGERGPVVVPGNAKASLLVRKVLRKDKPAMPPRKALSPAQVKIIQSWIQAGAGP